MKNGIRHCGEGKVDNPCYSCYGKTMIGGRKENQDFYGINPVSNKRLAVTVCDGMGGAAGGATASQEAVTAILAYLSEPSPFENGTEQVASAVKIANNVIYQDSISTPSLRGMGSTTTVALFDETAAYIAHVGDSRIYQLRNGRKYFRTTDHSRVFEMVKAGILTEEQARTHPQSNIIMRALGIRPEVEIESRKLAYKKGDRFILCCDGVWNSMPENDLLKILCMNASPEKVVDTLTAHVDSLGKKAGGNHDNLTAIIVDMKKDSEYQLSMFSKLKNLFSKK